MFLGRVRDLTALAFILISVRVHSAEGQERWTNILTFNAALPGNSNLTLFSNERRSAILASINSTESDNPWSSADVVCLQEVVLEEDRNEIVRLATAAGFTSIFADGVLESSAELQTTACSPGALGVAATCLASHCPGATDIRGVLPCALGPCAADIAFLSQPCVNCLIASSLPLNPSIVACSSAPAAQFASNLGLMVLSRIPLANSRIVGYGNKTDAFRRGYTQSELQGVGTFFCTHAFPDMPGIPQSAALFASENLRQMQDLTAAARASSNPILAGDMNTGPENTDTGVMPELEASYDHILAQGFYGIYSNDSMATCTWCATNVVVAITAQLLSQPAESLIIDHVFVDLDDFEVDDNKTIRVFDEAVIPVPLPVIGAALLPTSDHYGVQVSVRAINPPATSDAAKSGALLALLISALIVSVSL